MLNKSYRWLAFVLAVSVLLSCLPMSVFALEISNNDVIVEDESLREESVKHFQMPDGSYTAVVYTKPVHRRDSDGVWQDIDNRMSESTVKNKQAYVTSDGRTVFPKKITGDDPTVFELSENGYSIKVSFADDGIKNTTAKLSNHAAKYKPTGADDIETQYKKLKTIDNNTTVSYKNLLKGMTLEYVLSGNDVKENIIINKKADGYVYSFIYELDGLTAALKEDGSIDLVNENSGEPVGSIPVPYMYDDDGAVSYDVSYTLEDLGDGMYKLTVSADEEWINSSDCAFPVVIDPTITFTIDSKDTYITSYYPNSNFGESDELWVSPEQITFLQFTDLPRLGDYVTVTNATLDLHYYYHIETGSLTVGAYQVTENWMEYALTWNTAQEMLYEGVSPFCMGTAILPASPFFKSSSTPGLAAIDVTDLVQAWFAGMPNYGMAIKYEGGSNVSVILNSKETYTGAYYEIAYVENPLPISNGNYRIKNQKYSDKYTQMKVRNSALGDDIVELRSFNGYDNQKWSIEYLHNGYYKIISVETGKALTAPNSVNEALTHENYVADAEQMWKITTAENNLFKFSPASDPSYYMAAGDTILSSNGLNVEMRSSRSDYKDEWVMESVGRRAIFILPGILGSSLAKADGTDVWLHFLNFGEMALEEDGTSVNDIVSINKDNYGANDTYSVLYDSLQNAYSDNFDIVFFDYDFRLSIDTAAEKLAQETAFYDEIVLVAHSMGGLVGAKYLASSSENRNKTAALITLGTPFVGSAKCIDVMESGKLLVAEFAGIDIDVFTGTIKEMSKNCFSAYQLLPTSSYYALIQEYPLVVNGQNYTGVYAKLRNTAWGKASDGSAKLMFNEANRFHSLLKSNGTYVLDRSDVTVYTIAGTNINTIKKVILDSNYNIIDWGYSADGDGVVLTKSAGYGTPDKVLSGVSHMALVSNGEAIAAMKSVITQTTGVSANAIADMTIMSTKEDGIGTFESYSDIVNSRGWITGYDNRRINIYADVDACLMIDNMETIEKGDFVYDTYGNEIGSVWSIGNSGKKLYALYNGVYSLTNTTFAKLQYMNDGYYDKVVEYEALNTNTTCVFVSDYDSKEIVARDVQDGIVSEYTIQASKTYTVSDLNELNAD